MIDLIYTSGNNRRYAQMTLDAGWLVGMRSDKHAYVPISFIDIDYKHPDFERHMRVVQEHNPQYAIVPDMSDQYVDKDDVMRALKQAEQLSAVFCGLVFVVPKLPRQLAMIPRDFAIAFSVPTSYGGAMFMLWDKDVQDGLADRRIHLLGGNPHIQMQYCMHLSSFANVVSADGNMFQFMSGVQKYWQHGSWKKHPRAGKGDKEVTHECIQWSLQNVSEAWNEARKAR